MIATGRQLPLAGTLFKRAPLTAVLDTSLQVADIYQATPRPKRSWKAMARLSAGWVAAWPALRPDGSVARQPVP